MNVTVLGGSGFIGSHFADTLVLAGHNVTIFHSRGGSRDRIAHIENAVRLLEGNVHDGRDIAAAIKGAQIVVHLISSTVPGSSFANPVYDVGTNIAASIGILDQCVREGVDKVVFVSSGGTVYGVAQHYPVPESHPLNPISPYGISKVAIEKYLGMYHYHYGLDYTALRLSNPFGSRQLGRGQGVLAAWIHQIARGAPIEIWGDGSIIRDYIHIDDAVRALELATTTKAEDKVFNVGSGRGYSITELHCLMELTLQRKIPILFKETQKADVPINILDISLIARVLGWEPKINIAEGLKLMTDTLRVVSAT